MVKELIQARIKNIKQRKFVSDMIKIYQHNTCKELGLGHCPKGLALYRALHDLAESKSLLNENNLIMEYYNEEWINEREDDFDKALYGYPMQIEYLDKLFPDIMDREGDIKQIEELKTIINITERIRYEKKYFDEILVPRINKKTKKYEDEK